MRFSGTIMQAGQVIQQSVTGEYREHIDANKSRSWGGTLTVPSGQFIPKGLYQLMLDDGRSGDVNVETHFGAGVVSIGFSGLGQLK